MTSSPTLTLKTDEELFDDTAGYDDETGVRFAPGLTDEEKKQATVLYRLFNELWGVCIIKGDPGMGKDLFGNWLAHKVKRYFPWKHIWRDEKPRKLFGEYAGLFNENVLVEDLERMRALAVGTKITERDEILEKAADDWVSSKGRVMLKNSLVYLTELWRYCYNREPHSPMNKTMGGIHKEKRHIDMLEVGTVQLPSELDKKTCLPWVDWEVTCTRSSINKTGFVYFVQKVKYDRRLDILVPLGRPYPIAIDAGKPRAELGDGKIIIKRFNYKPETEEERVVMEALKSGIDTYQGLLYVLENDGDMEEREVLETIKELKFHRRKRVIDFPCFFSIYNSKSVPQMRTRLRIQE